MRHCWWSGGARWAQLSISEPTDLLGFPQTTIFQVYREWPEKKRKYPERKTSPVNVRG